MNPNTHKTEPKEKRKQNRTQMKWEPLFKRHALPFIVQGEGRVDVWENPVIRGILCPVL